MASLTLPAEGGSASSGVLVRLRTAILDGVYAPNQKLASAEMQDEYQVGVGTLREAFSHLVSEGFVTLDAGKGYRVAPVSLEDARDIAENRVELEMRAIRKAIRYGDDLWEVGILSTYHLLEKVEKFPLAERFIDPTAWTNSHRDFHHALIKACNSKWLLHFHRILYDQAHRYRMLALRHRPPGKVTRASEHRALMDAVLARDVKLASSLAEAHIRLTLEDVEKYALQAIQDSSKSRRKKLLS